MVMLKLAVVHRPSFIVSRLDLAMAEAVFAHEASQRGFDVKVDSAGTAAYHVGETPDARTVSTCKAHAVPINSRARQVRSSDFKHFDYIFAMDKNNLEGLQREAGKVKDGKAKVMLFSAYGDKKPIADPYYGGQDGFEASYEQCTRYSREILDKVMGPSA
ncbi:phosphotyrosine protein phosphatase [Phaffia rhodozyma]|uniref:Phosphotyrosine protein phosphatase n=1 Tax=Phaffia rhodozyma TaxID=264483 RepID=A0A0F7SL26_PHARH|nr:phosphotyrosine protein phosphatase [Phaffia rhodozyma]